MVTLLALQQQWQNLETNVQIDCQYVRSPNVTRYRRPYVGRQCDFIIRFDLYLSGLANSNSEKSKWMTAGMCFLSLVYRGGGGEATESLNDLSHRIFGNTKEHTK